MEDLSIKEEKEQSEENECEDFALSSSIKDAVKDLPEVLSFIQRLQECIVRQRRLLHRLYDKLKTEASSKNPTKDGCTQTNEADVTEWQPLVTPENIVEDIKNAAENAVQQSGFVYEASSGMYYDYSTGYYYNAELGLYYDGQNGIYYYLDESSKTFQFHSQVTLPEMEPAVVSACTGEVTLPQAEPAVVTACTGEVTLPQAEPAVVTACTGKVVAAEKRPCEDRVEEIPKKIKLESKEEGECSDSSSEEESEIVDVKTETESVCGCDTNRNNIETEDCSKPSLNAAITNLPDVEVGNAWPPCLRVVVKETGLEDLSVGSLFIVTCTGGSLGREGDHAIFIPDINISKHHAKVSFSEGEKCYTLVDLGSRNGTYVDGKRVSVALRESEPVPLHHGTVVKVGCTRLECHVHPGRETCTQCEPGCIQPASTAVNTVAVNVDHETREARHRSELRKLRKRFGLDKLKAKEVNPGLAEGYKDRAEERRRTVGSQDHHEKTDTASVHQSIKSNNKGFKMLAKMGWSEGQSLGKDSSSGIMEPVTMEQRPDKAGLGVDVRVPSAAAGRKSKRKAEAWKKAQERFQQLEALEDLDDS